MHKVGAYYGFPPPLEVDRFISRCLMSIQLTTLESFRPLSRWIGLYPTEINLFEELKIKVTVPSRGKQVYIKHLKLQHFQQSRFRPLSRYIGLYQKRKLPWVAMLSRYRPLSKYIGLYQTYKYNKGTFRRLFSSPLEVDRFISHYGGQYQSWWFNVSIPSRGRSVYICCRKCHIRCCSYLFPSPREVGRFISFGFNWHPVTDEGFPSPLEVYRFISRV